MKKRFTHKLRTSPSRSGTTVLLACIALLASSEAATAQDSTPGPTPAPPVASPGQGEAPPSPATITPPSAKELAVPLTPLTNGAIAYSADELDTLDEATGDFAAHGNVMVTYRDLTITADKVTGNFNRELIFTGHAKLTATGAVSNADAIHVYVRNRSYRLDNPRATLEPSFLRNQVVAPVYVYGGDLFGARDGYSYGDNVIITTCIEPKPDYELRSRSAELIPHKLLILRHVGIVFFGQKLVVLPILKIPLNEQLRRFRTDYLPEFGQNINEGYFARFPYAFAEGAAAAALVRLDFTQKKGEGYRFEQEYLAGKQSSYFNTTGGNSYGSGAGSFTSGTQGGDLISATGYGNLGPRLPRLGTGAGPQNGGLFAIQGYFNEGFDSDFNASFRHQQGIGGSNRISVDTELQNNSYYSYSSQTNKTIRLDFAHDDTTHGVTADASLNYTGTSAPTSGSSQITGTLMQGFAFDTLGLNRNNLNYSFNLSRYRNTSPSLISETEQVDSSFQLQHFSRDYNWNLQANKTIPITSTDTGGSFGTLERLPELQLSTDTINFKGGFLHSLPLHLDLGVGEYSEPGSNTTDNRVLLGLTVQNLTLMKGNTEVVSGGGFEQRLYGDGAAQYIVRNATQLRQHLGGRSGFDLTYDYEQPEGGTPFLFDTYTRSHYLTAEGGYLNDKHFQLAARVGYDFTGTASAAPWQSLSTRMMWRPTPSVRFDSLFTYDPNTTRFFSASGQLRLRARNDFAVDLITQYDPTSSKFSQINTQFDMPLGRTWRIAGLVTYNGYTGNYESTNFQVTHHWDCMEAAVSYTNVPYGFRPVRELFFSLRITAFPMFHSFARGPAGQSLGPGIGQLY